MTSEWWYTIREDQSSSIYTVVFLNDRFRFGFSAQNDSLGCFLLQYRCAQTSFGFLFSSSSFLKILDFCPCSSRGRTRFRRETLVLLRIQIEVEKGSWHDEAHQS